MTDLESRAQSLRAQPSDVNEAFRKLAESNDKLVEAIRIISVTIANSEPVVQALESKMRTCDSELRSIHASIQAVQTTIAKQPAQSSGNSGSGMEPASESRCVSSLPMLRADSPI